MEEVVYFAQYHPDGPIKIGTSCDVATRIRKLQELCPYELFLLGTVPGGAEREAEFHKLYRDYRIRGEWFHPVKPILDYIATQGMSARPRPQPIVHIEPQVRISGIASTKTEPKCKICVSPHRTDIDLMIASGLTHTEIVKRMGLQGFEVNKHNVSRHARRHVEMAA